MASGLDQNRVKDWLNITIGESTNASGPFTAVLATPFSGSSSQLGHIRLMTANGSSTVNGTELSGGSYVQGTGMQFGTGSGGCFAASNYATASAQATTSNGSAVSQSGMPASTLTGIEIWDSAGTAPAYAASNRWWWGALSSSVTTNNGDTLTFSIASISVVLSA